MNKANVIEIFSSVQGEGVYIGYRQIFVRLADCNLNCPYCDTDFSRADFCNVETSAGSMNFSHKQNPLDAAQVIDIIRNLSRDVPTHSVSFTGGEPLIQYQFVGEVAHAVKDFGLRTFLETNGTLPNEFEKIANAIDIISMDIKLFRKAFSLHRQFLVNTLGKDLYVKIVVADNTELDEFLAGVALIASVDRNIPLVIQPVTPVRSIRAARPTKILEFQAAASRMIRDVRVIPQAHKFINLL